MPLKKNQLKLYNSLTRKKEKFVPITPGFVGIYICGPTVYGDAHLGHAKSYISFDVIVRYFRHLGYRVRYVQNITDVGHLQSDADEGEDKIAAQARLEKLEPMEIAERYTIRYFRDMDALNVLRPDITPHASGHIPEQIAMVQKLLDKDIAYEKNGNVYFSVEKFPGYGKLSGRNLDDIKSGTRVGTHSEKKNPADFALWKKADATHIMRWQSPWSEGYPGWHLECSCMSSKYLGDTFDIHGGGMENKFPHHECEIAQSESANGKPFVHYWMHNNMVTVDGTKMGKSLGNFITVQDALKSHGAMAIRFFILSSHYRSTLDFSKDALDAASKGMEHITHFYCKLQNCKTDAKSASPQLKKNLDSFIYAFEEAMDNDFSTPKAIAAIFGFIKLTTPLLEQGLAVAEKEEVLLVFQQLVEDVLGLKTESIQGRADSSDAVDGLMKLMLEIRSKVRMEKNYALSDAIRDGLKELGISIKDTPKGAIWE